MTSSLPKPLQNDFDTIVIDLLSRYSLDNKSVQKFVQGVAQHVRDVRQIPRTLQPAKTSTGRGVTETKDTNESAGKPNFIARLENLQNTFNKGGLLGVFFEYLKNRQTDAKAKVTPTEELKTDRNKNIDNSVTTSQPTKTTTLIEKTVTQLEKLQEAFDGKGLINIAQSILDELKKRSVKLPDSKIKENNIKQKDISLPTANSSTYNTASQTNNVDNSIIAPQTVNNSTVKTNSAQAIYTKAIDTTTNIDAGRSQAQSQNLLPDEINVVLGGINDYGENDLKRVLKSVLADVMPKEKRSTDKKTKEEISSVAGDGGLLGLLADLGQIGGLFKGILPVLSKFGTALGVAGAAVAGNYIGGKVGEMIGSNEQFSEYWYGSKTAGKEAYEKYGTGIEGFTAAAYDYMFGEGKQLREDEKESRVREEKLKTDALERSKKSLEGTAVAQNPQAHQKAVESLTSQLQEAQTLEKQSQERYEKAKEGALEGWNPFHDESAEIEAKQYYEGKRDLVVNLKNRLAELEKINPSSSSEPKTPDITNNTTSKKMVPEVKDAMVRPDGGLLVSSPKEGSLFQLSKNDGIVAGPMANTVTPEAIKTTSSMPPSVTETHITNNNVSNKTLEDIAHNTEKTNKTLLSLSESIFKLAKNINISSQPNNTVLVNNGQQTQAYTSTAQIAANNVDSIRLVRQQFLAATT